MGVTVERFILFTGLVILMIIVYWSGLRHYLKIDTSIFMFGADSSKPNEEYATDGSPRGNMMNNSQRQTEQPSSNLNVSRNNYDNVNKTRITSVGTSQNPTSRHVDNISTTPLSLTTQMKYKISSSRSEIFQNPMTINNANTDFKITISNSTKLENRTTPSVYLTLKEKTNSTAAATTLDKLPNRTAEYNKTSNVTLQSGNVSSTVDNRTAEKTSNGSNSGHKHNVTLYVSAADLTGGRLGNQMFKYASLLGIARSQQRTLVVPSGSDLQNTFKLHHVADMPESSRWKVFHQGNIFSFDTRLMNLTNENVRIRGYLQSYKYFQNYADEVRQEFIFADSIANAANLIVHKLVSQRKGTLFVGVHIRRGDFLKMKKLGYAVPEKSYFEKAFNWMQSKFPNRNITYLVASDDLKWCNENLRSDNVLPLPNANPAIHMAILSSCDHVIISGGTYGWWGSFLAGGYVVYFKGYMSRGTTFGDSFNPELYYPPLWIGMEN